MRCIKKEQFECVHLTKQNRDEALKILNPRFENEQIFIEEDNDKYCGIRYLGNCKAYYFYNHWYVKNVDSDYVWNV